MNNYKKLLVVIGLIFVFLLVYSPHFDYPFPFHIDEWHQITQTKLLLDEGITGRTLGPEAGFSFILLPFYALIDLVTIYKFLPALWASLAALILFWVVYKKVDKFLIALAAVIFFASIKSNVNITGLWFFTPLTFSIPFIYLYIYFYSQGLAKQNKKYILISLAIMAFLIPIHAISVLFAVPLLIIYSLIFYPYLLKEYKFFSLFLIIPILGVLFYKFVFGVAWVDLLDHLVTQLQFKRGWGVLELKNSFTEVYSWLGYVLALVGATFIILEKKARQYSVYLLWPLSMLVLMIVFRYAGVSWLSPFQRNIYYFAISLPLLSALGLYFIIVTLRDSLSQLKISQQHIKYVRNFLIYILIGLTGILIFQNYYNIPEQVDLYRVIDQDDYQALKFLQDKPRALALAIPTVSEALYPVGNKWPVGTLVFYGEREVAENFFLATTCATKQKIIDDTGYKDYIKYLVSPIPMDCGWELIYDQNNKYIYDLLNHE